MAPHDKSSALLLRRFNEAQSQLVIQTADLPLGTLADMVEHGSIDLKPSFQRRERWSVDKQSALIESFLLNVPVPPVYLAEEQSGKYTAIDGKQRLRAIADFIGGRFKLRNLEKLEEAEGYLFSDFPEEIRNPLRLRPFLRVVTLLKQSDVGLKYEVFLRLNKGGEKLNNQEIRNVAFRGKLNDAIYDLANSAFLRGQLKIQNDKASAFQRMDDAEYVLRFFTLFEKSGSFSGSLVREMDGFLARHQHDGASKIEEYRRQYNYALDGCRRIWGELAFKRPVGKIGWRDQFIAGMYDAQMVAVAECTKAIIDRAADNSEEAISRTRELFDDDDFEEAVRVGTNTPSRIQYRINAIREMLHGIQE